MHEILDLKHQPDEDYIWSLGALGEYKMMPDHLKSILKDYKLAFGDKIWCELLTRVKVEALLCIVLALIKKRDFGPDTLAPSSSLQWQLDAPFTYKPVRNKHLRETITPRGEIRHALFYGSQDDIDTNLVVVITKWPYAGWGNYHAQVHMGKLSVWVIFDLLVSRLIIYFSDTD
ncbi:hypothetical protein BJX68DRAFT_260698 [Aspergillus pseudodeflectus]|uniref:Uncharacterized protein n=1 Tax=Aspergillus pseudodeflectus TaxID=176178 RepID=A0ABR4LEJ1_9EURO